MLIGNNSGSSIEGGGEELVHTRRKLISYAILPMYCLERKGWWRYMIYMGGVVRVSVDFSRLKRENCQWYKIQ